MKNQEGVAQMSRSDWPEFGSEAAPSGLNNLLGARPGTPPMFGYDGPMHRDFTALTISFESTHDALQRVFVAPPLQVDRDVAPVANIIAFTAPQMRGRDGRLSPYTGVLFQAPCVWKGRKGNAGYEFIDGAAPAHDKSYAEQVIYAGVIWGMLKKFADIRFYVNGVESLGDMSNVSSGDSIQVTLDRRGRRLIDLRAQVKDEIAEPEKLAMTNRQGDDSDGAPLPRVSMDVREIPTVDYSGYSERSIMTNLGHVTASARKAWIADPLSLEFSESELDALDLLNPVRLLGAAVTITEVPKTTVTGRGILEQLPLDAY